MSDEPITTPAEDDVEAHLLKEALATGAAAAAVLAGAGAATGATTPQNHYSPNAAVLPDPGGMPAPRAPKFKVAPQKAKSGKHVKAKTTARHDDGAHGPQLP